MAVEIEPSAKRNRTRSPSYPYLALPAALEKAAVLWSVEGRHPAAVSVAMQHWGYKEDSSTGYSCVAALKKFGLVDHDGMGHTRQIRLSALALAILLDKDPGSADRRDALRRAALNPRIHAELWERYGADLPSEQTLRRFLVIEKSFNEASVDELLAEYRQTMAFAGLGRDGGGGSAPVGVPIEPVPAVGAPPAAYAPPGRPGGAAAGFRSDRAELAAPAASTAASRALATNHAPTGHPGAANGAGRQQTDLFGQSDNRYDPAAAAAELVPLPPGRRAQAAPDEGEAAPAEPIRAAGHGAAAPWSIARRELPVPLDNGLVARVPYPMSEEDFLLLMDTLQLWKKRLVRP